MSDMRVALRADASPQIGIGHVARCLALARALDEAGAQPCLVSRRLGVDTQAMARQAGVPHRSLDAPDGAGEFDSRHAPHAGWAQVPWQQDATQTAAALREWSPAWVVVDHYAFDAQWHREVQNALHSQIAVVDDLADRDLDAAILVDQNLAEDSRGKYAAHWPADRPLFGGPRYALLGPQYATAASYRWRDQIGSIGIFMGGTDAADLSRRALEACRSVAGFRGPIEVVTTSANPRLGGLRQACARWESTTLTLDLPQLSEFFARHDLQIGAGGGATWERCCIGVPTLSLVGAENQASVVEALARRGIVRAVTDLSVETIGQAVTRLIDDAAGRRVMAERSRALVDGRGAWRVALALMADRIVLRPALPADAERAHRWRNDPRTRRYFNESAEVAWGAHVSWWEEALKDPLRRLFVAACGRLPIGVLRLDLSGASAEISLYLDPQLTGIGLGTGMLAAGQRWIVSHEPAVSRLSAHVHESNRASAAAFARAGFARASAIEWSWESKSVRR